jgi:hypothetical protein
MGDEKAKAQACVRSDCVQLSMTPRSRIESTNEANHRSAHWLGSGLIPDSSGRAEQPSASTRDAGHEWNLTVRPLVPRSHRHSAFRVWPLLGRCQAGAKRYSVSSWECLASAFGRARSAPILTPLLGKDSLPLGAPWPCHAESAGLARVIGLPRPAACQNQPWRRAVRNESPRPDESEWIWDYLMP